MKLFGFFILSIFFITHSYTQSQIVEWSSELIQSDEGTKLVVKGDISDGWFIYSQHSGTDGPIPTSFEFESNPNFKVNGPVIEKSDLIENYSELFETNVKKFKSEAIFEQNLVNYKSGSVVKGTVTYMCCNSSQCLPPRTVELEVKD